MKLTGRTILITGGSVGIGLAFALKFLELGNEVIVTGRRQAVLDQVKAKYRKLHTIQSDVADPAQIAALAARVKSDRTTELAEGGGTVITTDELVKQSFALLKAGTLEIRPGQSKQLALMRRLAPNFINRQLWKSSKKLVPVVV